MRDLKSELSGSFERTAVALVMTPSEYDAQELRTAMKVWAHFNTLRIHCDDIIMTELASVICCGWCKRLGNLTAD